MKTEKRAKNEYQMKKRKEDKGWGDTNDNNALL